MSCWAAAAGVCRRRACPQGRGQRIGAHAIWAAGVAVAHPHAPSLPCPQPPGGCTPTWTSSPSCSLADTTSTPWWVCRLGSQQTVARRREGGCPPQPPGRGLGVDTADAHASHAASSLAARARPPRRCLHRSGERGTPRGGGACCRAGRFWGGRAPRTHPAPATPRLCCSTSSGCACWATRCTSEGRRASDEGPPRPEQRRCTIIMPSSPAHHTPRQPSPQQRALGGASTPPPPPGCSSGSSGGVLRAFMQHVLVPCLALSRAAPVNAINA